LDFFHVLTCPSTHTLQHVSAAHLLAFFPFSNLFLPQCLLVCKCPCSLKIFLYHDLSSHLHSAGSKCCSLIRVLFMSLLIPPFALCRM
jgi:hypothetical protein